MVTQYLHRFSKVLLLVFAGVYLMQLAGCGGLSVTNQKSDPNDLSGIGVKPDSSWHQQYLAGRHARYACNECHVSVARTDGGKAPLREIDGKQICEKCHSADYWRKELFDHERYKTGKYCNSCHFSDTFRQIARVGHDKFHHAIGGDTTCVSCHENKNTQVHKNQGIRGSCQKCHKYPTWKGATFNHAGITNGCAGCHQRHYDGSECEWCHTQPMSWSFRHGVGDVRGCDLCHHGNYDDD